MRIAFSQAELQSALPPPGRYRATIEAFAHDDSGPRPRTVYLRLRVRASWISSELVLVDHFILRGRERPPLAGLRRLLRLFHALDRLVVADQAIELDDLIGLDVLVDVEAGVGAAGYPVSAITNYSAAFPRPPRSTPRPSSQ